MGLAEKHPTDEGKYQATYSDFGHGKGNGKSRSAVYKNHKAKVKDAVVEVTSDPTPIPETEKKVDFVEPEIEENTKSTIFESISWLDEDDDDLPEPTIPSPIRSLGAGTEGELSIAHRATQAQLIRWGYMGLDRGLTHWGRGVMNEPEWSVKRHPSDYDALEASTMHLLDANGVSINLSPGMVWATVVSAAYVPPVTHIAQNAELSPARGLLKRIGNILMAPARLLRRRRSTPRLVKVDDSES